MYLYKYISIRSIDCIYYKMYILIFTNNILEYALL